MKKGFKVAEVEQKLRDNDGNMAAVARCYDVHRSTMKRFVDKHPTLLEAAHDSHEVVKDDVEDVLIAAARKGEAWAVCFYLKCKAKDRGYIEKTIVQNEEGVRERVVVSEVEPPRDGTTGQAVGTAAPLLPK